MGEKYNPHAVKECRVKVDHSGRKKKKMLKLWAKRVGRRKKEQ